jgi:hypothetical protein
MTDLAKYMSDPDIINEPLALRETHAIRLKILDETRNFPPEERAAFANKKAEEIMKKYNLSHLRTPSSVRT